MITRKLLIVSTLILICFAWLCYCTGTDQRKYVDEQAREGHALAKKHCVSCHLLPEAEWLNKTTWANYVLPKMGELVGFRDLGMNHYVRTGNPDLMTLEEWNKITHYYLAQSPVEPLPRENKSPSIQIGLEGFKTIIPAFRNSQPVTTMVKIDSLSKGIFFGDGLSRQLYVSDPAFNTVDSFSVGVGISNLVIKDNKLMVLTMGVLQPSDLKIGQLLSIDKNSGTSTVLLDSLQRPVHASYADLNNDGREDIVICEFGNITGQLGWFENLDKGNYRKHILRPLPGAIRTELRDINNDGLTDIIAMMAQGDEGIFLFKNQGGGKFLEERLLHFPPTYGSNYFEMVDMNGDGYADILATNGDNGDYPPILKAYHGIRVYLNNKQNKFGEAFFLPMNGAGKAMAVDFDKDGDLDIASISFFPDHESIPAEGFLLWENQGDNTYKPSSFNEVSEGNWISMDAGDFDGDGLQDIVIGNADFGAGIRQQKKLKNDSGKSSSIIILQNIKR